jgi:hypothetical protein
MAPCIRTPWPSAPTSPAGPGWRGTRPRPATQYAALLPVREWVSGPGYPETLKARGNLAAYTGVAGDAAAVRDQFAALLPVFEWVPGPEHPDTLTARASGADRTGVVGDPAGARGQFAALLSVRERSSALSTRTP